MGIAHTSDHLAICIDIDTMQAENCLGFLKKKKKKKKLYIYIYKCMVYITCVLHIQMSMSHRK